LLIIQSVVLIIENSFCLRIKQYPPPQPGSPRMLPQASSQSPTIQTISSEQLILSKTSFGFDVPGSKLNRQQEIQLDHLFLKKKHLPPMRHLKSAPAHPPSTVSAEEQCHTCSQASASQEHKVSPEERVNYSRTCTPCTCPCHHIPSHSSHHKPHRKSRVPHTAKRAPMGASEWRIFWRNGLKMSA
jgi:hypothetical protein